MVGADRFAA